MPFALSHDLTRWLDAAAVDFDGGQADPASLLPQLAREGLFSLGVPRKEGGTDGDVTVAVEAVAAVSEHSMTAAPQNSHAPGLRCAGRPPIPRNTEGRFIVTCDGSRPVHMRASCSSD